ncbi:MAG: hypothetical protein P8Y65_10060, partial [Campylobacterales bacterium]
MEKFLELFSPQPGYKILDITAHTDALSAVLLQRLAPFRGRLSLVRHIDFFKLRQFPLARHGRVAKALPL